MKAYKIDLSGYKRETREYWSKAIQEHAFKLGSGWGEDLEQQVKHTSPLFLYLKNQHITIGYSLSFFKRSTIEELTPEEFLALSVPGEDKTHEYKVGDKVDILLGKFYGKTGVISSLIREYGWYRVKIDGLSVNDRYGVHAISPHMLKVVPGPGLNTYMLNRDEEGVQEPMREKPKPIEHKPKQRTVEENLTYVRPLSFKFGLNG